MIKKLMTFFIVGLVLICAMLTSCKKKNEYSFSHSRDRISSIELIQVGIPLYTLSVDELCSYETTVIIDQEEWDRFFETFYEKVTQHKYRNDPYQSVEGSVIRILYNDGCMEFVSKHTTLYQEENGRWIYTMDHFDETEFESFIGNMLTQLDNQCTE